MTPVKVLHIDDDNEITGISRRILEFSGFSVICAREPQEIADHLWREQDVLILDWMLPQTNALRVYDLAHRHDFNGKTLLLTARDISRAESLLVSERNMHYMRKPFGPASLLAMLTKIMAHS